MPFCYSLYSAASACRVTIWESVFMRVMAVEPVHPQETVSTMWIQAVQLRYISACDCVTNDKVLTSNANVELNLKPVHFSALYKKTVSPSSILMLFFCSFL